MIPVQPLDPEVAKFADLLTHRCGPREVPVEVEGRAYWQCWTCGAKRLATDSISWFAEKHLRAKRRAGELP